MRNKVFLHKAICLFFVCLLSVSGLFGFTGYAGNGCLALADEIMEQETEPPADTGTPPDATDEGGNGSFGGSQEGSDNSGGEAAGGETDIENQDKPEKPDKPANPSTADKIPNTNLVVSIKKDGKETASKTYTYAQMIAFAKTKIAYTSLDEDGTPQQISAQGIKLTDLMAKAGVTADQLKNVIIYSSAEGSRSFTKNFLFGVTRYAYPDLPVAFNAGNLNNAKGSGKTVSPMLAVRCCEKLMGSGENWDDMNYAYGMRICYGQLSPTDTCSTLYGSQIYKITFEMKSEKDNSAVGIGSGTQLTGGIDDVGKENINVTVDGKSVSVPNTITLRIGYVGYDTYTERKTFTFQELASLPKVKQIYTMLDDKGNLIMESAVGFRLVDLIAAAGIDLGSVQSFGFHSLDPAVGTTVNLQRSFLLDTPRYYYPAMPRKWNSADKSFGAGAMLGAVRVHTILTFKDNYDVGSAVPDYYNVNENNRFRLVMGQANAQDAVAENAVRWIDTIDVIIAGSPPEDGSGNVIAANLPNQTNVVAGDGSSSDRADMGEKFNVAENPAPLAENNTVAPRKTVYEVSQAVVMPEAENNNLNLITGGFSLILLCAGLLGHMWFYRKGF